MKNFEINLSKYILAEAYKFTDGESVINAIETKQCGCKVNPEFKSLNGNTRNYVKRDFDVFFKSCENYNIKDTTYGVQFLLGHTSDITLENAVRNDAIYEFLKSYKKPWVKELDSYNDFVNKNYNQDTWHKFEKEVQENQVNHGKVSKGSGNAAMVNTLYQDDTWTLMIPKSFEGEKAIAFYGKKGEVQKPTAWCTRADKNYYDHYTQEAPLYIIRNWKTGRSYQLAFMQNDVCFLDQNDENGDEITGGDLKVIPNCLLKKIKDPHGDRTLYDFKHAEVEKDPSKENNKYIKKAMNSFENALYGKPRDIGNGVIAQDVLNYSERPNNRSQLAGFFTKTRTEGGFTLASTKYVNNTIPQQYSHKDKATLYYLKSKPGAKIIYTASKESGLNSMVLTNTNWKQLDNTEQNQVEIQAAKDFGLAKFNERKEKQYKSKEAKGNIRQSLINFTRHSENFTQIFEAYKNRFKAAGYDFRTFVGWQRPEYNEDDNSEIVFFMETAPRMLRFINNKTGRKDTIWFANNNVDEGSDNGDIRPCVYRKASYVYYESDDGTGLKKVPANEVAMFKEFASKCYQLLTKTPEFKDVFRRYQNTRSEYGKSASGKKIYESYFNY